jgi:hypothetical protein
MRGHNDVQATYGGVAQHRSTAARAAGRSSRSDHFGRLLSYNATHSDSAHKAHGAQLATCGECALEGAWHVNTPGFREDKGSALAVAVATEACPDTEATRRCMH